MIRQIIYTFIIWVTFNACNKQKESLCLNDIQIIGSHNSYKVPIEEPLFQYIYEIDSISATSLQYGHVQFNEQLNMGLRSLELDVFHDPHGGYYNQPKGLSILADLHLPQKEFDAERKLNEPGLKVFHIQDIDFRSHHLLFKDCLNTIKQWSKNNPGHTPIIILINAKDKIVDGLREPLPFTAKALDSIDMEIASIFTDDELITPDFVRGNNDTLEKAILKNGWPKLIDVKDRFLFVLDEKPEKNELYLMGHEGLKGRIMFVNSQEGRPESAFRVVNNPVEEFGYIQDLVKKGYMVRTRADEGTIDSRINDYSRFEKAKASGAQVISTDYYIPTDLYPSDFKVCFDNNKYERINLLNLNNE